MQLVEQLIAHPDQLIEIIGNDEVGEDSICALCDNNLEGECILSGAKKIKEYSSADLREALRYGLKPGYYTMEELLNRKQAFSPKARI